MPFRGLKPVHVALAVRRNPIAMLDTKPHSISCACHATPCNGPDSRCGANIQIRMETAAQAQPAIYKGRKPRSRKAFQSGSCLAGSCGSCNDTGMALALAMEDLGDGLIGLIVKLVPIPEAASDAVGDRKSTRLNSSHVKIS